MGGWLTRRAWQRSEGCYRVQLSAQSGFSRPCTTLVIGAEGWSLSAALCYLRSVDIGRLSRDEIKSVLAEDSTGGDPQGHTYSLYPACLAGIAREPGAHSGDSYHARSVGWGGRAGRAHRRLSSIPALTAFRERANQLKGDVITVKEEAASLVIPLRRHLSLPRGHLSPSLEVGPRHCESSLARYRGCPSGLRCPRPAAHLSGLSQVSRESV